MIRPSTKASLNRNTREHYGRAFDTDEATTYHQVRPGYRQEILEFFTTRQPGLAIDLGAGTGLFTKLLVEHHWDVVAVDPSAHMLGVLQQQYPHVDTVISAAETLQTQPWQHQVDLVVSAQAWHWVDPEAGSAKVAQLLKPSGVFGVVHHQLDTSQPWVLRLSRIMHSGDIHPVHVPPIVSSNFSTPHGSWWHWEQPLIVADVHRLMMTRAFYLKTHQKQRQRMHDNLNWYLMEHLGYAQTDTVQVPYVTAAWSMHLSELGASA